VTTPAVTQQLRDNARRGAEWLDEVRDGWWVDVQRRESDGWRYGGIDLDAFDMVMVDRCIGGQLEGSFGRFVFEYGLEDDRPFELGFDNHPAVTGGYRILTEAWRELILERRAAHAAKEEAQ
jgi:hypothetical protein